MEGGRLMDLLKSVELEQQKENKPSLKVGNTVRVHVRIKEGNRERIQVFEGTIIKIQGGDKMDSRSLLLLYKELDNKLNSIRGSL